MSQSSSASTLLKASEISLNGGLQSVLQSLDVQLEDELVRYRRECRRQLQAKKAAAQQQVLAAAGTPAVEASIQDAVLIPDTTAAVATKTNDAVAAPQAEQSLLGTTHLEVPELGETESDQLQSDALHSGTTDGGDIAPNSSSLALTLVHRPEETNRADDVETHEEEDYFASSAALLESLNAMPEEALQGASSSGETSFLKQLMTPAGMGASLLVLTAGAASGYLMMNPQSVSHLRLSELFAQGKAPGIAEAVATGNGTAEIPGELPPGAPDLTQREFIQLSLSNLGSLDPDGNPIHNSSSLGNLAGFGNSGLHGGLSIAAAQPLPGTTNSAVPGITQSAGGGGTAPGGAATLPSSVPTVVQPIPQSGLLSSLSNAVSGRTTAEQMMATTPLPAIVAPAAPVPAPASVAIAPVIQPVEVTQLPAPTEPLAPEPAPTTVEAPTLIESSVPAESYIEEYIPPAPASEAEISYWEAEPEAAAQPVELEATASEAATSEAAIDDIAAEAESYGQATYIVLAPYISDAALADIQAIVPDAYVENYDSGAYVQAGVFDDAASAGDLLMRLQEQGISASVENR